MQPYAHHFINNNVTGQSLLNLTVDDLTKLRVEKLGHQEIILEALESLKNLVRLVRDKPCLNAFIHSFLFCFSAFQLGHGELAIRVSPTQLSSPIIKQRNSNLWTQQG